MILMVIKLLTRAFKAIEALTFADPEQKTYPPNARKHRPKHPIEWTGRGRHGNTLAPILNPDGTA